MLTGTWDRNASLVMRWILLMKFIADVLHSSASIRKWSRTSKVNTVWGFLKLAGKSLTQSRSWTYWSDDLVQWHHRMERLKIPVDDTTIRLDRDQNCVLQPSVGWVSNVSHIRCLHRIHQGPIWSHPPHDVDMKDSYLGKGEGPKTLHGKVDPTVRRIYHSTFAHDGKVCSCEQTHSRDRTKNWIQSNLDTDVWQILIRSASMRVVMVEIHVGEFL